MTHREELWNKAYKKIFELYGETPDIQIVNRFFCEKRVLADGCGEYFNELANICRESLETHNEKLVVKNTVASCFTAYLLGASEINPLPPHYYCEACKRVEWQTKITVFLICEEREPANAVRQCEPMDIICLTKPTFRTRS